MIVEYHRPHTIDAALELLTRPQPETQPLGGGTVLNRPGREPVAVVDLQALGLDKIELLGNNARIGATVTLQALLDSDLPEWVRKAARQEAGANLRQAGTVAGTLVSAGSRSPLCALFLALDARLVWAPEGVETSLGDFLARRSLGPVAWPSRLILAVQIPLQARAALHQIGRTPTDWPLVLAAGAAWPGGRRRLVLGGHGPAPLMALDGSEADSAAAFGAAARDAFSERGDEWASAQYRKEVEVVLAQRCAREIEQA